MKRFFIVSLAGAHVLSAQHVVLGNRLNHNLRGFPVRNRTITTAPSVVCKFYLEDTIYETGMIDQREMCVPVVNNEETEHFIALKLPPHVRESAQYHAIRNGRLFVQLTHADIIQESLDRDIVLYPENEFVVLSDSPHFRYLKERKLRTMGQMTVAIVRISTNDSTPTATKSDLENTFDDSRVNIKTQYDLCSNGKLKLMKVNNNFVMDVVVDKSISQFSHPSQLVEAASTLLSQQYGVQSPRKFAKKILFCLPPGTGNWVASASLNYWKAIFNDGFCTSLSAMSHEFAHLIGVPHANENGGTYNDRVGYMSHSYDKQDWPRRCFNGANSGYLGWYEDKTVHMSEMDYPRLIKLAGVVDYRKVAYDTRVLINLGTNKWIQYNRAKDFNTDTGKYRDAVVITQQQRDGTQVLGAVGPNETFRLGSLIVEACQQIFSDATSDADYMLVSVGVGRSVCPGQNNGIGGSNGIPSTMFQPTPTSSDPVKTGAVLTPAPRPMTTEPPNTETLTQAPTRTPTTEPTIAPTSAPTELPTVGPTASPTSASTAAPTAMTSETQTQAPHRSTEGTSMAKTQTPVAPNFAGSGNDETGHDTTANAPVTSPPTSKFTGTTFTSESTKVPVAPGSLSEKDLSGAPTHVSGSWKVTALCIVLSTVLLPIFLTF